MRRADTSSAVLVAAVMLAATLAATSAAATVATEDQPSVTWKDVANRGKKRILRPSRTFDLFAQSTLVPENLLMAKRNVSKLFVIPAFPTSVSAGRTRSRARTAFNFAAWLLTHVDPDGAVVLAAHHEVGYDAMVQAMKEQERTNLPINIWGNIMISPVTFAPSRYGNTPEEQRPALWSHLAAIDAAEERYVPDEIVLLDAGEIPETQQFPSFDVGSGCVELATAFDMPNGTIVNGPAFLDDFHKSEWRYWFVRKSRGDQTPTPALHTIAREWSVQQVFAARLKSAARAVFAQWNVSAPLDACAPRNHSTVFVMVAGGWDLVTVDQVLTLIVFNPNAFVILVTATRYREVVTWIDTWVPVFHRANIYIKQSAASRKIKPPPGVEKKPRPLFACVELEELNPVAIAMNEEEMCVGAMIQSVFRVHKGRIIPRVRAHTVVLLPLRNAIVPHAGALEMLRGFSSWQTVVAVPDMFHTVFAVLGIDTAVDIVSHGMNAADAVDVHGLRAIGHEAFVQASSDGEPRRRDAIAHWVFDVRGRHSAYDAQYPQWRGNFWPAQDVRKTLNQARSEGALVVFPIETHRGMGLAPWRYELRRRRLDPITVRAMRPDFKANHWCDVNTLEGCAMGLSNDVRWHPVCERRNEKSPIHAPIKCANVSADTRVRPQDIRPLRLRAVMPTMVSTIDTSTELERDAPVGNRLPVDVLYSVIAKGDEDFVEMAEAWLEYCLVCVLAIEVGPKGNPGAVYDTLSEGLDPTIFDRVIVNPKRGMTDPFRPPLMYRHLHNIAYARCFVAPLRVLMVAANESPMKPGLEVYMLAHSTTMFLDITALVHESKRDDPHWLENYYLGTGPRVTQAAQHLVYNDRVPAIDWLSHAQFFCTGDLLYTQSKTLTTGMIGFEGGWFTGAQWKKYSDTFRIGYWVHGFSFIEHMFLQPTVVEDELRREYWPESSFNITNKAKPPGRNTCFNARLHVPGPMSLEEIKNALDRAMPLQFTLKRVGTSLNDPGRAFLAERRKHDVAKMQSRAKSESENQ